MTQALKQRARISRAAIERLYINMRHLFIRGHYKPNGISGRALKEGLLTLQPEIYGSMSDPDRVELVGLKYVLDRLPLGIEECRFIHLIAREGFENSGFETIIPAKRRRNCYRIDKDRMYIELTRGRSDIYDILTHLTFLSIEADKIKEHALDKNGRLNDAWKKLEEVVELQLNEVDFNHDKAVVYLSSAIGRTVEETKMAVEKFAEGGLNRNLFHIIYWLGKVAVREQIDDQDKEISFSTTLRDIIGQHTYGSQWAGKIKDYLTEKNWLERPVHIISANEHSTLNSLYGKAVLEDAFESIEKTAFLTADDDNTTLRKKIRSFAFKNGVHVIEDRSGTNLTVQIFDLQKLPGTLPPELTDFEKSLNQNAILLVMDYAFGEQAYECFDELLKPHETKNLNIHSISIMGKAGTLKGQKGDIMIPNAHVFEGTADNYPFDNDFTATMFEGHDIEVEEGTMITVLGTSLQNRDVLRHFLTSTWNAIGLEMEGAHYQKAIQSAARIRKSIDPNVKVRYAYYASDNPLETGSTLASGSLGMEGVKPTYLITVKILNRLFA